MKNRLLMRGFTLCFVFGMVTSNVGLAVSVQSEEIVSIDESELLRDDNFDASKLNEETLNETNETDSEVEQLSDNDKEVEENVSLNNEPIPSAETAQEDELVDSGPMDAGEWRFYSNGLLYLDGVVTLSDRDKWAQYALEIKHIEIGHADLIGSFASFFIPYSNVETVIMNETYLNSVTDMTAMFANLYGLRSVDFGWAETRYHSKNVTTMNAMFQSTPSLSSLDLSSLDTSNVLDMGSMFSGATGLTSLDLSNFDTRNVTNMSAMFYRVSNIKSLDLSSFDTRNVLNMGSMFSGATGLTSLDLSNFDTSNVTVMNSMFSGATGLTSLDLSNFDTSNVTTMVHMFSRVGNIKSLDLSSFDTSSVNSMRNMFSSTNALTGVTSVNLSSFDTSKVTDMSYMFAENRMLSSLDVSGFNTKNVTTMSSMFRGTNRLTSLNLSNFDTSNVTTMNSMFRDSGLTSLDVSNFDTSKVTDMTSMFWSARSLSKLDMSSFDTSHVTNMNSMLLYTDSLSVLMLGKETRLASNAGIRNLSGPYSWKDTLKGNYLATNELYAFHDNLKENNTYKIVETVTLKFNSMGGSPVEDKKTTLGEKWSEPKKPTKDGFVFSGWYLDQEYTTPFDFSTVGNQDTTVYAKWVEEYVVTIPAKITLNLEDELQLSAINNGDKTLQVNLNQDSTQVNENKQLILSNKSDFEVKALSQLTWTGMNEQPKWTVLSISPIEKSKETTIQLDKPADTQAGSYEGLVSFDITYD